VCEPDDRRVRIVEETENSLIIRINCSSLDDVKEREPQTQRGFRGRGFRGRRGRGRVAVADRDRRQQENLVTGPGKFSDRESDFDGSPGVSQYEDERVGRGGARARGRKWYGTGWRRGGAGRYFRQRYGERPVSTSEPRQDDPNLEIPHGDSSSPKLSDMPVTVNQDSDHVSDNMPGEQSTTENVDSVNTDRGHWNKSVNSIRSRPTRSANRRAVNRNYIVRRSSAGRYRRASSASGPSDARVSGRVSAEQWAVKTEDKTKAVVCSCSDVCETEDWDAECESVEPAGHETSCSKTDTDTVETNNTTSVSTGVNEELDANVDQVNNSSS